MSRAPSRRRLRLDQSISILKNGIETNALNEPVEGWTVDFTVRAKAYPSPGFERVVGDTKAATLPMTFEVRAEPRTEAISPAQRIRYKGVDYNIIAPVYQPSRGANVEIVAAADR